MKMTKEVEEQIVKNVMVSCYLSGHKKRSDVEIKKIIAAANRLEGLI